MKPIDPTPGLPPQELKAPAQRPFPAAMPPEETPFARYFPKTPSSKSEIRQALGPEKLPAFIRHPETLG